MSTVSIQSVLAVSCLVFCLIFRHDSILLAEPTSGLEVMEKQEEVTKSNDEMMTVSMELIHSSGKTRERKFTCYFKNSGDIDKYLIKFLYPNDIRNTGLLTLEHAPLDEEDDQWLYLPELRKTKRIAGSEKRDSFVGSDLTYEDMRPENLDTHSYELLGVEEVDGVECFHILAFPATPKEEKDSAYSKRELWIRTDNYLTVLTKFYNRNGNFYKIARFTDISPVKGYWRANRIEVEDFDREHKTVLVFEERKVDEELDDSLFTVRELERRL